LHKFEKRGIELPQSLFQVFHRTIDNIAAGAGTR